MSPDKIILGIGYNGFPRGCPDDKVGLRCSPGLCFQYQGRLCPAVALTNLRLLGSCPGRGKRTPATRWTPSANLPAHKALMDMWGAKPRAYRLLQAMAIMGSEETCTAVTCQVPVRLPCGAQRNSE